MTQLTDRQIEAQIDRAIARQAEIDATEPRADRVLFDDGRIKCLCKINCIFRPKVYEDVFYSFD
jgi:hypothetical protein